jgi:hypothetical protein
MQKAYKIVRMPNIIFEHCIGTLRLASSIYLGEYIV